MSFLDGLKEPWLHIVDLDVASLTDRISSLVAGERNLAARFVRGGKMPTEARLFDEFAAALQFPY